MWRYDLHVHTNHSPDGRSSAEAMVRRAEQLGLSGIAITDHDTMDGAFAAQRLSFLLEIIPGCEITLADGSHVIGLYLQEMIQGKDLEEVIFEILGQGGLVMIPHPFRAKSGLLHNGQWADERRWAQLFQQVDFIEVYSPNCSSKENQLAQKLAECYDGSVTPIASSDAHRTWQVGIGQLCLSNWRLAVSTPAKLELRCVLNSEGTDWSIYAGSCDSVLSICDDRPTSVKMRRLLKARFPMLTRIWQRSRSTLRTMYAVPRASVLRKD